MDDYSDFFSYYSQPNLRIDDTKRNSDEVVDRSRCAVCQTLFKTVPRHEERCWCVSCEQSLMDAVVGQPQYYTMLDSITHEKLGVFLAYSGYCSILRQHKLKPVNVESNHPKEAQMAERWYQQYAKEIKRKK